MISATCLGHQTWLVEGADGRVLVDPVVTRSFGNDPGLRFEIWPPREIDVARIGALDAVVITNEHLDHFHIESLGILRSVASRAMVSPLFPAAAAAVLERLGYSVRRYGATGTGVAGLTLTGLSPDARSVPVWESRCSSVLLTDVSDGTSVFVQSDTLVPEGSGIRADIFVATNNTQRRPPGWQGFGLDNLLDDGAADLEILQALATASRSLESCNWVTFSGSGYRPVPRRHGPLLLADSRDVANRLNDSALEDRFLGLAPGDRLWADGRLDTQDWIAPVQPLASEPAAADRDEGLNFDVARIFPPRGSSEEDLDVIAAGLESLERLLAAGKFGTHLVDVNLRAGKPLAADERFVVHLRRPDGADVFTLDLAEGKFRREVFTGTLRELILRFPTGLSAWASDLARVFDGSIQIWELCTIGCIQWYLADPFLSPVGFLYSALAEPVQPALTAALYGKVLDRLAADRALVPSGSR
jgi:hypothetical protein